MTDYQENLLNQFAALDIKRLLKKLYAYAEKVMKERNIFGIDGQEIVEKAIEKILTGRNKWDYHKYPDPMVVLRKNIHRDIRHEAKKRIKDPKYSQIKNAAEIGSIDYKIPDSSIDNQEFSAEVRNRVENIRRVLENDLEASLIIEAIMDEIDGRSNIANYCGIKVEEYDAAMKRIRRVVLRQSKGRKAKLS